MKFRKIILIFLFFYSFLYSSALKEIQSKEGLAGSGERYEIELDVKSEQDLQLLNELGLDCPGLGVCTSVVDTLQLLRLKKANYPFRPPRGLHSSGQSQGIKQTTVFQLKLEIKNELELNLIKRLGLSCAKIGECTTEVGIEQMNQLKQNGISFSGIREGIRVEGTSSPEGIHSETFKPTGSAYGKNDLVYSVPCTTWVYSPITIDNAPSNAKVDEIEVHYEIFDFDCLVNTIWVDLTNQDVDMAYNLWRYEGSGSSIYETERVTSYFDYQDVNQTWRLYVWDASDPGRSIIASWEITIWFSGPPVYKSNSTDYHIPDGQDSICSSITINTAPVIARVSSLDVHYDIIHTYIGDLLIWVSDFDQSNRDTLCKFYGDGADDIHETVTGITDFNGEMVNQTWKLWARDVFEGDIGYIDFWSITLWYQDLPDLVIKSITPSNSNPIKGENISVDMLIKNQGSRESDPFNVGLYYNLPSPPNIYTPKNNSAYVSWLEPDSTQLVTVYNVTSADTATWNMYGLADCDGWIDELNDTNNYIGPKRVKWWGTTPWPDLVVEEAWVSNDCNPTLDESVYVDVVIRNAGGSSTPGFLFYTAIFYNRGTAPNPATPEDACHPTVGSLAPDAIDTFTFVLPNPSIAETWIMWLLVDSDDQVTEGNENNNVFGPIYVYWGKPPVLRGAPITRDKIIENAMKFVNVVWTCPIINRTPPSKCKTWDSDYTVGVEYQGEPYEWGGWDIPGDITNPKCFLYYVNNNLKRAGSHDENDCQSWGDPSWATGVDCAGLVSRAWDIFYVDPNGYRSKPGVYTLIDSFTIELPDYYSLKRGDALISTCTAKDCGKHTFLFNEWVSDTLMEVIEARSWGIDNPLTRNRSRVRVYNDWTISKLTSNNYNPYKYKDVQETQDIIPGDANGDGKVSISDIVYLITYIFKGGAEPFPPCKADVNDDNKVSVADVVYLINYLFKGGAPLKNGCS